MITLISDKILSKFQDLRFVLFQDRLRCILKGGWDLHDVQYILLLLLLLVLGVVVGCCCCCCCWVLLL